MTANSQDLISLILIELRSKKTIQANAIAKAIRRRIFKVKFEERDPWGYNVAGRASINDLSVYIYTNRAKTTESWASMVCHEGKHMLQILNEGVNYNNFSLRHEKEAYEFQFLAMDRKLDARNKEWIESTLKNHPAYEALRRKEQNF